MGCGICFETAFMPCQAHCFRFFEQMADTRTQFQGSLSVVSITLYSFAPLLVARYTRSLVATRAQFQLSLSIESVTLCTFALPTHLQAFPALVHLHLQHHLLLPHPLAHQTCSTRRSPLLLTLRRYILPQSLIRRGRLSPNGTDQCATYPA
ncbi:hypothetical protein BDN72DRAFT_222782 [Pluteus cervinus]|uniref:Uncharacterized protein n=1 Tax=Pluteus cervinus TaxID=181527 RepID=A0ACD3AH22_9AGAR|nr:hypothetical protein BDN72DRAFT_222782 [Pluteus cervinus]